MGKIKAFLASLLPTKGKRKLWCSIVIALCALALGLFGAIEWELAIQIIAGALGGFIGIEGLADILGRLKVGGDTT